MSTMTAAASRRRSGEGARPLAGLGRLASAGVLALAVVGLVVSAILIATTRPPPVAADVGTTVELPGGSFVVTRAATTMVPTTQGPPTAAKMTGTVGTEQLQVWVDLTATGGSGLAYSPDQFRLVRADGTSTAASGSTLVAGVLARDSTISGQVWFDDIESLAGSRLEFTPADGPVIRIAVDGAATTPMTGHGHS